MALTPAEKQQRYRERHLGIDGAKERIQVFVSVHTKAQLGRLARHYGYTVTRVIEDLAAAAESALLEQLPWRRHKAYLDSDLQRNAGRNTPTGTTAKAAKKRKVPRSAPRRKVTP